MTTYPFRTALVMCLLAAVTVSAAPPSWTPAVYDDAPVLIELPGRVALEELLAKVPVASFDREQLRPLPGGGLAWRPRVTPAEVAALLVAGYVVKTLPDDQQAGRRAMEAAWAARAGDKALPKALDVYPTVDEIGPLLAQVEADHPGLARRFSWGTTILGRTLWGIVISDDVANSEPEPEVRLSSTIHGDEPVGTVLLLELVDHLTNNYGQPGFEDVTALVDGTEIHILPLHNPDGYAVGNRGNSNNIDLNRNFLEPAGTYGTLEQENAEFVAFSLGQHFVISTNAHTGTVVVNYPWDYTYERAPDDAALIDLSTTYASLNPTMASSSIFPGGITNGADWYVITGSLQDWSYDQTDCIDLTIELNNAKAPPVSNLPGLWDDNRASYLAFIAAAQYGVHGLVTDAATGAPLDATVAVTGIAMDVSTDPTHGDYYKLLPTGTWEITFTADGYHPHTASGVTTVWGAGQQLDVALVAELSDVPRIPVAALSAAPNPFNGGTLVRFTVSRAGMTELAVFDLRGRRVRTLFAGVHVAGADSVVWNGRGDGGQTVAAGVYVARLEAPGARAFTKITYVK